MSSRKHKRTAVRSTHGMCPHTTPPPTVRAKVTLGFGFSGVRTRSVRQRACAQHHGLLAAVVVNHHTERHLAQRTSRLTRRQRPLRDAIVAAPAHTPARARCQSVE